MRCWRPRSGGSPTWRSPGRGTCCCCSGYWWSATAKRVLSPPSDFFVEIEEACAAGAGAGVTWSRPPRRRREGETNPLLSAERVGRSCSWPPPPVVPEGTRWAAKPRSAAGRRRRLTDPGSRIRGADSGTDLQRITGWQRDAELLLARAPGGARAAHRSCCRPRCRSVTWSTVADGSRCVRAPAGAPAAAAASPGGAPGHQLPRLGRAARRQPRAAGAGGFAGCGRRIGDDAGADLGALQDGVPVDDAGQPASRWRSRSGSSWCCAGSLVRGRIDAVYRATTDGGLRRHRLQDRRASVAGRLARGRDPAGVLPAGLGGHRPGGCPAAGRGGVPLRHVKGETGLVRPALPSRDELARLLTRAGGRGGWLNLAS